MHQWFLFLIFPFERREEVHGEAQRVLRTFPGKNEKESAGKQMPSFPEMVHYIQDKVLPFSSGVTLRQDLDCSFYYLTH